MTLYSNEKFCENISGYSSPLEFSASYAMIIWTFQMSIANDLDFPGVYVFFPSINYTMDIGGPRLIKEPTKVKENMWIDDQGTHMNHEVFVFYLVKNFFCFTRFDYQFFVINCDEQCKVYTITHKFMVRQIKFNVIPITNSQAGDINGFVLRKMLTHHRHTMKWLLDWKLITRRMKGKYFSVAYDRQNDGYLSYSAKIYEHLLFAARFSNLLAATCTETFELTCSDIGRCFRCRIHDSSLRTYNLVAVSIGGDHYITYRLGFLIIHKMNVTHLKNMHVVSQILIQQMCHEELYKKVFNIRHSHLTETTEVFFSYRFISSNFTKYWYPKIDIELYCTAEIHVVTATNFKDAVNVKRLFQIITGEWRNVWKELGIRPLFIMYWGIHFVPSNILVSNENLREYENIVDLIIRIRFLKKKYDYNFKFSRIGYNTTVTIPEDMGRTMSLSECTEDHRHKNNSYVKVLVYSHLLIAFFVLIIILLIVYCRSIEKKSMEIYKDM
ncbi:hypothetical protein SNEBB_009148 [Seison nebaliae]|nr:hypothetical protein SNEBB_009148 [Seison nebaliae]